MSSNNYYDMYKQLTVQLGLTSPSGTAIVAVKDNRVIFTHVTMSSPNPIREFLAQANKEKIWLEGAHIYTNIQIPSEQIQEWQNILNVTLYIF